MNANTGEFNPYVHRQPGRAYQQEESEGYGGYQQPQAVYAPQGTIEDSYIDPTHQIQNFTGHYGYEHDQNYSQDQYYLEYGSAQQLEAPATEFGYYYELGALQPTLHGAPISSLCYSNTHQSLHVASHTQSFGGGGRASHKAAMLVAHSTFDGTLYSSCAGHPEASISVLTSVYTAFYGGATGGPSRRPLPPHALEPSYSYSRTLASSGMASFTPMTSHWGISDMLATNGYLTSVSPSGVRVHTQGGLCVSDYDIEGMVCATSHPHEGDAISHVSVGGIPTEMHKSHVHCMDLYQNLRIVSSQTLITSTDKNNMGVMDVATNHSKNTIIAGCSDGTMRILDGSGRIKRGEVAKVRSHIGGVSSVAVSEDGMLIVTSGFASRSNIANVPHCFPDPHLLVYDTRYLGRGGIVHPFSGIRGSPRFADFIPNMEGMPRNRIIAASSQTQGGLHIMVPFETETNTSTYSFIIPLIDSDERMTSMCVSDEYLAIGTNKSNVFQYQLYGYDRTKMKNSQVNERMALDIPNYVPPVPGLSIDPIVLLNQPNGLRNGPTDRIKSVFGAYTMCATPTATPLGNPKVPSTFGPLADQPMISGSKRGISHNILREALKMEGDFIQTIPTSALKIDLFEDHNSFVRTGRKKDPVLNPNKLLYNEKLASLCFQPDVRWGENRKKHGDKESNSSIDINVEEGVAIPERYRATVRPHYKPASRFEHANYNTTGIWPGWDYPTTMPSSHVPCVLMLLYFVPEVRSAMLATQFDNRLSHHVDKVPPLGMELGFLYHHIESISRSATTQPNRDTAAHVGAFVPSNFLTAFTSMPEADALALLDNNPAAVDKAQRPEAFYRFLLHHLDKEATSKKGTGPKIMDSLHGLNFVSINQFVDVSGKPTIQSNRALTVGLDYDRFIDPRDPTKECTFRFGEVLRHALCRESRLRAWCQATKSYETIVQRKIATTLPEILSLSCACAGRKEEDGMLMWRGSGTNHGHWLPEFLEVEIQEDGNVVVREMSDLQDGKKEWVEFKGDSNLPKAISELLTKNNDKTYQRKYNYRLEAVVSFIRDDMDPKCAGEGVDGHHVLHVRVPQSYKKRCLTRQRDHADQLSKSLQKMVGKPICAEKLTLTANVDPEVVRKRAEITKDRISAGDKDKSEDWVLFNGFVVNPTVVEDARGFNVKFKEPCLVVFRATDGPQTKTDDKSSSLPITVMQTRSLSTGRPPKFQIKNANGTHRIIQKHATSFTKSFSNPLTSPPQTCQERTT